MRLNLCSVLGESGHGAPHALAQMNSEDLLIVFGSYPYSGLRVEYCRQAQLVGIFTAYAQSLGSEAVKKLEDRENLFKDMRVVY